MLHVATVNSEGSVISLTKKVHPVMSQCGCRRVCVCVYITHTD